MINSVITGSFIFAVLLKNYFTVFQAYIIVFMKFRYHKSIPHRSFKPDDFYSTCIIKIERKMHSISIKWYKIFVRVLVVYT